MVYRLIGVEMNIKDVNDFNLRTKELGCNYWSTYTKSGIGEVPVTSLHHCKETPPFLPLNNMTMLWSYLSLFN